MPPIKRGVSRPVVKPAGPRTSPKTAPKTKPTPKPSSGGPSVDIVKLLANPKTRALGDALMKVDIEQGNANGRLDYVELPKLDAATRTKVAGLMTGGPGEAVVAPPVVPPASSLVAAEKAGPLKREDARSRRFVYSDEQLLNAKGLPGSAFDLKLNAYTYNPFVKGESNHADPALLRAQARYLELTSGGELRPGARSQRNELLKDLKRKMTVTGLDALELAYFPAEKALAIVKRAAAAARVDPSEVLITLNGSQVRLPAWERGLGDLTAVPIRPFVPTRLPVTETRERVTTMEAEVVARERARQDRFFAENPGASWSQYNRYADSQRSNPADEKFWRAMERWLNTAEIVDWMPPSA